HFYWETRGFQNHAQVLITSWVVITILIDPVVITVRNPQTIQSTGIFPTSKTHIGEEYGPWVPFIETMFFFIFVSNWSGALLPRPNLK
ncbi:hypothetical protein ZWY2020_028391, partial [Hordeum vulgare]